MAQLPAEFPLLRAVARAPLALDSAVDAVRAGLECGQIRNAVLAEAKDRLNRAVYQAWDVWVTALYFHRGGDEDLPAEVRELDGHYMGGLHDAVLMDRRLAKLNTEHPAVAAMRQVLAEALPLAEAVSFLKDHVSKGRAPRTDAPAPLNPHKVIKTCPCCFRPIAVVNGRMAHHGYRRPGHGTQSASCAGVRFPPLEESNEGLVWLVGAVRDRLQVVTGYYDARSERTSITVLRKNGLVDIKIDDPDWGAEFGRFVREVTEEKAQLEFNLAALERKRAQWKPERKGGRGRADGAREVKGAFSAVSSGGPGA